MLSIKSLTPAVVVGAGSYTEVALKELELRAPGDGHCPRCGPAQPLRGRAAIGPHEVPAVFAAGAERNMIAEQVRP